MKINIEPVSFMKLEDGTNISDLINKEGYFNSTALARKYGKQLYGIRRLTVIADLTKSKKGKILFKTLRGGQGTTMVHESLLMFYVRYFAFYIQCGKGRSCKLKNPPARQPVQSSHVLKQFKQFEQFEPIEQTNPIIFTQSPAMETRSFAKEFIVPCSPCIVNCALCPVNPSAPTSLVSSCHSHVCPHR